MSSPIPVSEDLASEKPRGEEVVLLDETGRSIGSMAKDAVHTENTPLHLAFSCYIFDANEQLLVTRRALHKATWGGVWTNSCCGHPAPGESTAQALRRRVLEELGLTLTECRLALPRYRYRMAMPNGVVENEMCPVYVATTDQQPRANASEVAEFRWMPWESFREEVLAGSLEVSPWCVDQVRQLSTSPLSAPAATEESLPPAARATLGNTQR